MSIARALGAGLRFRPMQETARDTVAWHASLPEDLGRRILPDIPMEKEAQALEAWSTAGG